MDVSNEALLGLLIFLLVLSAFFSGSETGLVSLNRYRLRHLASAGHRGANRASKLLERPDRLIGIILLGNNLVNIWATTLTTLLALRLFGDMGLAIAPIVLTVVILIFAEALGLYGTFCFRSCCCSVFCCYFMFAFIIVDLFF